MDIEIVLAFPLPLTSVSTEGLQGISALAAIVFKI